MILLVLIIVICATAITWILCDLWARDHDTVDRDDWPHR